MSHSVEILNCSWGCDAVEAFSKAAEVQVLSYPGSGFNAKKVRRTWEHKHTATGVQEVRLLQIHLPHLQQTCTQ